MEEIKILDEIEYDVDYLYSNCIDDIISYFKPIEKKYLEQYRKINYDNRDKKKRALREELEHNASNEIMNVKSVINKRDLDLFLFWYLYIISFDVMNTIHKNVNKQTDELQEYKLFKDKYTSYLNNMTEDILKDISLDYDEIKRFLFNSYYQNGYLNDWYFQNFDSKCFLGPSIANNIICDEFTNKIELFQIALDAYKSKIHDLRNKYKIDENKKVQS